MGTSVSLTVFHDDPSRVESAFEKVRRRVQALEAILTDYDRNSETSQLTIKAYRSPQKISRELSDVLQASDQWFHKTGGAFDASLGNLTRLWRKYRSAGRIPDSDLVDAALQQSGWGHVIWDPANQTVCFDIEGLRLDFGAIGKGYIVDAAFRILVDEQLPCCLVNISGNMRCGPAPPDRNGWRIEIAPLDSGGPPLRRIEVENIAIATSGDLWQFIEVQGQRRSHILDPQTGYGVIGPVAATVLATTATAADAFATAACILEPNAALRVAEQEEIHLLLARRMAGRVLVQTTPEFPR